MALSGNFTGSTANEYITPKIVWTATQSVTGNTSTITAKLYYSKSSKSTAATTGTWSGSITIGGSTKSFSGVRLTLNPGGGYVHAATHSATVTHNSDGTKSVAISAKGSISGTTMSNTSVSKTVTLDTIPRKSSLSASNGTLGTAQTLTVDRKASSFTHTITYKCGSASGTVCTKSSDTSISWTPPLSLAQQNTTGASVSITLTITTYSGSTSIGSNAKTISCSIPASVKPSVSVAVSDPLGYATTYGGYVQGLSKLKIVVTASGSQGSTIKSYKTEADGKTYTAATVTTDAVSGTGTGTLTVKVTVTDSRGRTATASTTVSVLAYAPPKISALSVYRCDAAGNASSSGAYLAVKFSSAITALGNKNTATYSVEHKKSSASEYTTETLTDYAGQYSVSDGVFVFAAETQSSYNIRLTVRDAFGSAAKTAVGSSVKKLWSLLKKAGKVVGIAFDKIAEHEGVFDIGFQTMFTGGIRHPVLAPETDLNDVTTPNTYVGANVSTHNYGNCPIDSGTFTLEVVGMGDAGQVKQRITSCRKADARAFERIYYSSAWGEWVCVSDYAGTLLWSGNYYMTADHIANLSEPISKQKNGVVLVFARYVEGEEPYAWNSFFLPKYAVGGYNSSGHTFIMTTNCFSVISTKYLYIRDESINGNENNNKADTANGITYNNAAFTLKYVIGV